jgi:biopolymer transport protein ExbD
MSDRKIPEINAGSMADIAFLLLVFFLVTTTIQTDSGLQVTLPQWMDTPPPPIEKNSRNVLLVVVNGANQLSVNDQINFPLEDLKEKSIRFINNFGQDGGMSTTPKAAVISLQNDNATDYTTYLSIYNELQAAYNVIWESEAKRLFGRSYETLEKFEKMIIREGPQGGWKVWAKELYDRQYVNLSEDEKAVVRTKVPDYKYANGASYEGYPKFISEAEPNDFGEESSE